MASLQEQRELCGAWNSSMWLVSHLQESFISIPCKIKLKRFLPFFGHELKGANYVIGFPERITRQHTTCHSFYHNCFVIRKAFIYHLKHVSAFSFSSERQSVLIMLCSHSDSINTILFFFFTLFCCSLIVLFFCQYNTHFWS